MTALAIAICAVEGELLWLVKGGHDESAEVVRRLVRTRAELRSLWLPGAY